MSEIGRLLLFAGLALAAVGALLLLLGRLPGLNLGHLPGDFAWESQGGRTRVFIPLGTMLLVSIILTILVNVLWRFFR